LNSGLPFISFFHYTKDGASCTLIFQPASSQSAVEITITVVAYHPAEEEERENREEEQREHCEKKACFEKIILKNERYCICSKKSVSKVLLKSLFWN